HAAARHGDHAGLHRLRPRDTRPPPQRLPPRDRRWPLARRGVRLQQLQRPAALRRIRPLGNGGVGPRPVPRHPPLEPRPCPLPRPPSAAIVVLFAAVTILLGMIQQSATAVIYRLNPHLLRGPWAFIALSFGPALLIAPFGLRRLAAWSPRALIAGIALLCVT